MSSITSISPNPLRISIPHSSTSAALINENLNLASSTLFSVDRSHEENVELEKILLEKTLIVACTNGNLELVRKLVDQGTDIECKLYCEKHNVSEYTNGHFNPSKPLALAAFHGHEKVIYYLLKKNANLSDITRTIYCEEVKFKSVLSLVIRCASREQVKDIKEMFEKNTNFSNEFEKSQYASLLKIISEVEKDLEHAEENQNLIKTRVHNALVEKNIEDVLINIVAEYFFNPIENGFEAAEYFNQILFTQLTQAGDNKQEIERFLLRYNRYFLTNNNSKNLLKGKDLSKVNCEQIDFKQMNLIATNFKDANLAYANFTDAIFDFTQMDRGTLRTLYKNLNSIRIDKKNEYSITYYYNSRLSSQVSSHKD